MLLDSFFCFVQNTKHISLARVCSLAILPVCVRYAAAGVSATTSL